MAGEGLDALLVYSWKRGQVRYLSGYHPNYVANLAMVVLPREGTAALRIRFPFDLERARRESWIQDVAASGSPLQMIYDAAEILRQRGLDGGRVGLAAGDHVIEELPYSLHAALKQALPRTTLVEAAQLLSRARRLKSRAEFDLLRASARLADRGAEAAFNAIEPGCSEYEVVSAAEGAMRRLGAEAHLVVISSKGVTELVGPPEAKPIKAGDNVILEVAVQRSGYTTQVARVFYAGGPSGAQLEIYQAAHRAYLAAVAACRPGGTCAGIAATIRGVLGQRGLGDFLEQDMGHGIGLDLPEPPRIESGDHTPVEAGMALVIHPAVRVPGVGGAFLGGTVLVHPSGPEPIHTIPEDPYPGGYGR
jgi:Xaa-Pro aminopeptidase